MAGIGEASAILSVAQIGLQLAQTLVTVIGDYRDAATNINRLRDEIHLTSVCLQQLGDLASADRLIPGRGVLEATNLRERTSATIWEIRMVIKKGDNPLHPEEITKDDIDVSYFTAWKWALWTKKKLDGPRVELDRLKDSMTLTFVTHMAILANSEAERRRYEAQIPGYRRSCRWAEERYRQNIAMPSEPVIPAEILDAGPAEWDAYVQWKNQQNQPTLELAELKERLYEAGLTKEQISNALGLSSQNVLGPHIALPSSVTNSRTEYQAWSMDPFVGRVQMPVTEDWLLQATAQSQSSEEMWKVHSKLKSWYKKQIDDLIDDLSSSGDKWSLFSLKVVHRSIFRRNENPPALQVIVKGDVTEPASTLPPASNLPPPTSRMGKPTEVIIQPISSPADAMPEAVTYDEIIEVDDPETRMTDDELIQQQLDLYKSGK